MNRAAIKNKNDNYFYYVLIKISYKNQRIKILKELRKIINDECADELVDHIMKNILGFASNEEGFK